MNFPLFILIVLTLYTSNVKSEPKWYFQSDISENPPSSLSSTSKTDQDDPYHLSESSISNNFTEPTNASLYSSELFDFLNNNERMKNKNETEVSGRSAKMLDLDSLFGDTTQTKSSYGNRESRIVNDDTKTNLAIKGFIPIVGLGSDSSEEKPSKLSLESENYSNKPDQYSNQYSSQYSNQYSNQYAQHNAGPQDQRFIGAALQNIAASLTGQPNRKYGSSGNDYSFGANNLNPNSNPYGSAGYLPEECVCVPFYLCKNGYLEGKAKNNNYDSINKDNQVAQSIINQLASLPIQSFSQQQNVQQSYSQQQPQQQQHQQQQQYQQQQQQYPDYVPVDERSNDYYNETVPQYAGEVLSRMLGGRSGGCGVLRTCCKVPRDDVYQAEFQPALVNQPLHTNFQPFRPPPVDYHKPIKPEYDLGVSSSFVPSNVHSSQQIVGASYGIPSKPYDHHKYGYEYNKPIRSHVPLPIKSTYPNHKHHSPYSSHKQLSLYPGNPYLPPNIPPPFIPPPNVLEPLESQKAYGICGTRHALGIHGRVQNLQYHDSSSEFGEFPWQAAILKKMGPADSLYVCGGTLISPLFIATAAHCIKNNHPHDLKVRLGEWDVHREDEFYPYVEKFVQEIIIHPEFFPGNLVNDIALIRMDSPVDLSLPHILPACLPEPFETFAGHRCLVTGWGKNSFGHQGEFQSVLKKVDLPIHNHEECEHGLRQTRLGPFYKLHPSMLCAGGEAGKDACEGDGGSPLVCEIRGVWKVAGLVSWGVGCGQPGIPGIYVRLAHFRPWIDSVVFRYSPPSHSPFASGIISERSNDKGNFTQENRESSDKNFETTTVINQEN